MENTNTNTNGNETLPNNRREAKAVKEYSERWQGFQQEIAAAINANNIDNDLSIPDFVLAAYVVNSLLLLSQTNQTVLELKRQVVQQKIEQENRNKGN